MKKFPDIPGWMSEEDLVFLYNMAAAVPMNGCIVELGCWLGRSTCAIIQGAATRDICVVDTWRGPDGPEIPYTERNAVRKIFISNMKNFAGFVPAIYDMDTRDAADRFAPASVDFLFIDADHSEESVYADMITWLPKMKPEGVVAGHDWDRNSVRRAFSKIYSAVAQPSLTKGSIWYINVKDFGRGS